MNHRRIAIVAGILMMMGFASIASAHCQIPCGIYGDATRFTLMREHVLTIEKAMKEIERLGTNTAQDKNQLVRWVTNKESHADELSEIVTAYFMAQRIKPVVADQKAAHSRYVKQVTILHQILVQTMKAKQSTNREHCAQLRTLIEQFEAIYPPK